MQEFFVQSENIELEWRFLKRAFLLLTEYIDQELEIILVLTFIVKKLSHMCNMTRLLNFRLYTSKIIWLEEKLGSSCPKFP